MNKHLHRIIFNAARSQRMVVQETASSASRGRQRATRGHHGGGTGSAASNDGCRGTVAALATLMLLQSISAPALAQIVANPNAPANQRPQVLVAPNGVPLVNIGTPSAAGVSRNRYTQFDVNNQGAILNNSRGNVQTQLGGWVQGNPWLATGSARVILNEVSSSNPSQLHGYVEVAGQRAEVIIANPAGIQVDGGGFINASRATLTTGTPQLNVGGGLDGFAVSGGNISINGNGLDASTTDYTAILARALQVNAGIWANELKVVTGVNQVSADAAQIAVPTPTGAAPSFALDVAQLGGMYAGKITLIGTEAGVGVRNAGSIGAGAGGLVVTVDGRLENKGTIEGVRVELASTSTIDNRSGSIHQLGLTDLVVNAPMLSNTMSGLVGTEPLTAGGNGGNGGTDDTGTAGSGGGLAEGTGGESGGTGMGGTPDTTVPVAPSTPGSINAREAILNDGGRIQAGGLLTLNTPQINNAGGTLNLATLAVSGPSFSNAGGTVNVANAFSANVQMLDNSSGTLTAGSLDINTSADLNNTDGILTSNGEAVLQVSGSLNNTRGTLAANQGLMLDSANLVNDQGAIESAAGAIALHISGTLANEQGRISANTALTLQAGSLANGPSGTLRAGTDLQMDVATTLTNDGSISAANHTRITAANLNSSDTSVLGAGIQVDGSLSGSGDLSVTTTQTLAAHGTHLAAGQISLQGAGIDLGGSNTAAANITLKATQADIDTRNATLATAGTLSVSADTHAAQSLVNSGGSLTAGQLELHAANISNTQDGQIIQTGTGATTLAVNAATGILNNDGGRIAVNSQDLSLSGASLRNADGQIEHSGSGTLSLAGDNYSGAGGQITGNGTLALNLSGAFNQDGGTASAQGISLNAGTLSNRGGQIIQGGTGAMTIATAGAIDNTLGTLASKGALTINAGQTLVNQSGHIVAQGNLHLASLGLNNASGQLNSQQNLNLDSSGTVLNSAGQITAQAVRIDTHQQILTNDGGIIAATAGDLQISSGALNNQRGLLQASQPDTRANAASLNLISSANVDNSAGGQLISTGNLNLTAAGSLLNQGGSIAANSAAAISASGINNSAKGVIRAHALQLTSRASDSAANWQTLANSGGTLAANQSLDIDAGTVDNSTDGVISTSLVDANLNVRSHGQSIDNRQSGANGGIISAGALSLDAQGGTVNNSSGGYIGAAGTLNASAGRIDNHAGVIIGQADVSLVSSATDNAGGAGVDNTQGGSIQATLGGTLAIQTQGANLDNRGGTVASEGNVNLSGAGAVRNDQGQITAGDTLTVSGAASVGNDSGLLYAKRLLALRNTRFSGTGRLGSAGNIELQLLGDTTFAAGSQVSAEGKLDIANAGNIVNQTQLYGGTGLQLTAQNLNNHANASISSGGITRVNVSNQLINRGLIDGIDTQLSADTLHNIGSGRIYGDHIGISVRQLNNQAEDLGSGNQSATIASRGDLDIAVRDGLSNTGGSLILALGDLRLAGALDAQGQAMQGQAQSVDNRGAQIEALGNIRLAAVNVNNTNANLVIAPGVLQSTQPLGDQYAPAGDVPQDGSWFREVGGSVGLVRVAHRDRWGTFVPDAHTPGELSCGGGDAEVCTTTPASYEPRDSARYAQWGVAPPPSPEVPKPDPVQYGGTYPSLGGDSGEISTTPVFTDPAKQQAYHEAVAVWQADQDAWHDAAISLDQVIEAYNTESNRTTGEWRDYTQITGVSQSVNRDQLVSTDPGRISAGGSINVQGQLNNIDSSVIAGGNISVIGNPNNQASQGTETTTLNGTAVLIHWEDTGFFGSQKKRELSRTPFNSQTQSSFTLNTLTYQPYASSTGSGTGIGGLAAGTKVQASTNTQGPDRAGTGAGAAGLIEVTVQNPADAGSAASAQGQGAGGQGPASVTLVARTINPNGTLPSASLFGINPTGQYVVATDPRFANYRTWLSSDYLLNQLGIDPNATQKRLGDGFYEQKLIREQVAQLTGYRYLDGYASDEAQYTALMNAGASFAQAYGLRPGIALTPAQMAQLTSDIVWLVEQSVTLPDGSTQRVLVPQVYVRVQPGDLHASGALLSAGGKFEMNGQEFNNQGGTIAGRQAVVLNADTIRHSDGGRITGQNVALLATRDIRIEGASVDAQQKLIVVAGTDIDISSTTRSTRTQTGAGANSASSANTTLDRVAGLYVTGSRSSSNSGADGQLLVLAGNDLSARGAQVLSAGSATLYAGHNLSLGTVGESSELNINLSGKGGNGAIHQHQSREVGSTVSAVGDVTLVAGNDLALRAAQVHSQSGALIASAGNDLRIEAGQASASSDSRIHVESRSTMSRSVKDIRNTQSSTSAQASDLSGNNVTLVAGKDISVQGSHVNAQDKLLVNAGRDVNILAAQEQSSESQFYAEKNSGLSLSRQGIGYGKSKQSDNRTFTATTQAGSILSGAEVTIDAERDVQINASTVVADRDLAIHAERNVSITAGTNTADSQQASQSSGTFLGLAASGMSKGFTIFSKTKSTQDGTSSSSTAAASTVGSLGGDVDIRARQSYTQTGSDVLAPEGDINILAQKVDITEARESSIDTQHQSSKSTTLGAAPRNALVDLIQGARNTLDMAQATTQTGNNRVQALGVAVTGLSAYNTGKAIADLAADPSKAASVSIDFSLGTSKSQSSSTQTSNTGRGSTVAAAGEVNITATGAGADSDIHVRGSQISAGNNANLKAQGDLLLESSQDRSTLESSNKSSGSSIGVGVSFGASSGITLNASANKAKGNASGQDVVQQNTGIVAGNTATLQSGGDTTLAGVVVSANTVKADVGGNLLIQSRQDTSDFHSEQKSSGAGVSLCIPPICYGASSVSASAGRQNIDSHYASVVEQSGIKAGNGGFEVNVKGNTDLKGGAITSTDQAIADHKNSFETGGTLSTSDIANKADYKGEGYQFNVTVAVPSSTPVPEGKEDRILKNPPKTGGSAGAGQDSGSASSSTQASISGIAGDTAARTGDKEAGIKPIFDAQRVQKEVDAQVQITQAFGRDASKAVGDYAQGQLDQANALRQQARQAEQSGDVAQRDALNLQAKQIEDNWGESGTLRVAAHTVIGGLTGGLGGAAGAATGTLTAPLVANALADAGINGPLADGLTALASTAVGVGVGGAAGGGAAFNEVTNNYLKHADVDKLSKQLKHCGTDQTCKNKAIDDAYRVSAANDIELLNCKATNNCDALKKEYREGYADITALVDAGMDPELVSRILNMENNAQTIIRNGLDQRQCVTQACKDNASYLAGVGKGLAKITPTGLVAGSGIATYELTTSIINNGWVDTAVSIAQGIEGLPADLKTKLASTDPAVRGEALVDALSIGGGAALVGAKLGVTAVNAGAKSVANLLDDAAQAALLKSGGAFDRSGLPLLDLKQLSNEQKAAMGELMGSNTVKQIVPDGQKLARMPGVGETGIDDLYKVNRPDVDYVVVEYKFVGDPKRSGSSALGSTADGRQGSESWALGSGRIEKAVGEAQAPDIEIAIRSGRTETLVVRTYADGSTELQVLDAFGKPKSIDTSKVILPKANPSGAKL